MVNNNHLRVRMASDASPRHAVLRHGSNSRESDDLETTLSELHLDDDTDVSGGNGPRRIPFVGPAQPSFDRENRDFNRAAVSRERAAVTTSTRPAWEAVSAPGYDPADGPVLLVNPTAQRMPRYWTPRDGPHGLRRPRLASPGL